MAPHEEHFSERQGSDVWGRGKAFGLRQLSLQKEIPMTTPTKVDAGVRVRNPHLFATAAIAAFHSALGKQPKVPLSTIHEVMDVLNPPLEFTTIEVAVSGATHETAIARTNRTEKGWSPAELLNGATPAHVIERFGSLGMLPEINPHVLILNIEMKNTAGIDDRAGRPFRPE
jgi:hypothetical protein